MPAKKNIGSITMPAGEYIVGDPCYAVPGERWMEWLEAADYQSEDSRRFMLAELDGHPIAAVGTAHGDGCYDGSDGNRYPVDAGIIGLVPTSLPGAIEEQAKYTDRSPVVTFERDFQCSYEDDEGVITLGHIKITTDPDEGEDWYT